MGSRIPTRGRPRDVEADRAVLAAALDLLLTGGVEAVKIDAVAKRSGVARGTVYRRYASRDDLVIAALVESQRGYSEQPTPVEPTVDDMITGMSVALADPRERSILRRTMTMPREHPELFARFRHEAGYTKRDGLVRETLARAADQGKFLATADLEMIQELLTSAIAHHLLTYPDDGTPDQVAAHLRRALSALGYTAPDHTKESR